VAICSTAILASASIIRSDTEHNSDSQLEEEMLPKIAWLMSFPNSGTTYIINLITAVSRTATATNYGDEYTAGPSIPVSPSFVEGPFRLNEEELDLPKYILTKTHCGGWFFNSPPKFYVDETVDLFEEHCLTGVRTVPTGYGELTKEVTQYDLEDVAKAVHLIRNPFDNIVSRFHHEYMTAVIKKKQQHLFHYTYNAEGFQAWCRDTDTRFWREEQKAYGRRMSELAREVPCHAELYRYVHWHNNAFALSNKLSLPTHVLYYEDFQTDFEASVQDLLDFLQLSRDRRPLPFTFGDHLSHYTVEQRRKMALFVEKLASSETWIWLRHYFEEDNYPNDYYYLYS